MPRRWPPMARIAHLSDLHFGAHDEKLVAAVETRLIEEAPDLVVVSGDFTQRARRAQYREAEAFIERLGEQGLHMLGVPGNHDVPLYDVIRRFFSPLTRYKKYIDEELCPFLEIDDAAILGINTARSFTFKGGSVSEEQADFIRESFGDVDPAKPRILVTHHPFFELPRNEEGELGEAVNNQDLALRVIKETGVDLLLAGHNHRASTGLASDLVEEASAALVVQAGTATSTRLREEVQSFNMIDVQSGDITVTTMAWQDDHYRPGDAQRYRREKDGHWRAHAGVTQGASKETEEVA